MQANMPSQKSQATLWDIFSTHCGTRRPQPLGRALLSDANVALLTQVFQQKAVAQLGALAPPLQALTVDACDAFSTALFKGAEELGWLDVTARTLETANRQILDWALFRLSTEQSTWQQWREFAEVGVRLDERPEFDDDRSNRKELQRPGLGKGLFNPWESYGETRGLVDKFQPFNGLSVHEISDADDMRVQVVPWAKPAVHGRFVHIA